MVKLLDRAVVLASSVVTYVLAAVAGITFAADELAAAAPEGAETAASWLLLVATWLTGAVAVVRRVSQVAKDQRGLLPPD